MASVSAPMQSVPVQTTRIDSAPAIAVAHAGQGELVLFLHGIGGNKSNWSRQVAAFSGSFRAVAWDMRGYGDSDDYEGPLRFADVCDDILRVLHHFDAPAVHLVGLSMGGRVAFDFLDRHPQAVRSLTVCSASHRASQMTPERRAQFLASRLDPLRRGKSPVDIAPGVARSLLGPNATQEAYESLVASMSELHVVGYAKALEAVSSYEGGIELERIAIPTHVVAAVDDPLVPLALLRAMAARIPGAVLTEIGDCGHLSNLERPEDFDAAVLGFLRRLPRESDATRAAR